MTDPARTLLVQRLGVFALPLVFLAMAIPLWASGFMNGRGAADQVHFHVRVIQQFASQWPTPDLTDYSAAMSPGYHLLLTPISTVVGTGIRLQIVASLLTLLLLGFFGGLLVNEGLKRGRSAFEAFCAALPLACSMYVVFPGVWLQPDNAAWLLVLVIIATLTLSPQRWRWIALASALLAVLIFTRQSTIWLVGPMLAAAWLGSVPGEGACSSIASVFTPVQRRLVGLAIGLLAALPAICVFAWLYFLWGGLMPAQQRWQFPSSTNWATPAFVLSLIGVYSIFLIAWVWPGFVRLWRESRALLVLVAVVGALIAAIPETTFLREPRSSGLWNLVGFMDARGLTLFGRTSPLLLALAAIGAMSLLAWLSLQSNRRMWIFAAIILSFTAAQTANALCWQRYIEPLLLIVLGLMCVTSETSSQPRPVSLRVQALLAPARVLGALALAGVLLVITGQAIWSAQPPAAQPPDASIIAPAPKHPSGR